MNNSVPVFSIIIPTYNHANFIGRCLDSLLRQSYENWEAIIINNFSQDNTIEIVEEYNDARIHLVNNANNGIIAVSRNKGLSIARGEWICFLDSDDWWYPIKLQVSLQFLSAYDLVYHDLDIYTSIEKPKGVAKGRVLKENIAKDLIINGNGIINSSVLVRKSIVNIVGEITEDKNLIAVEDFDYWIRIAKVTNRFKYINKSLGAYWEGENISYSTKQIDRTKNLLGKYIPSLTINEQKAAIALYNFNSARMYHNLGIYDLAKKSYLKALYTHNLNRMLKSIVGYVMCSFRIK